MNKLNHSSLIAAFEPGDFLFGLEKEAREYYYDDLKSKLILLEAKYHFVTIDDMVRPLEEDYIYGNNPSWSPLEKHCTPVRNHGRFLLSSPAFFKITEHISSPSTQERNKIIISCLTAIQNHRGRIHFCLDGIDLDKARNNHPSCQQEYHSFTSYELRHIAKHYQDIGNKILFYLRGEQVEAPWDALGQEPHAWLGTPPELQYQAEEPIQPRTAAARRLTFISDNNESQPAAKRARLLLKAPNFDATQTPSSP